MSPMLHPAPLFKKRGAKLIADGRGMIQAILFHSFIFIISRSLFLILYSCFLFTDSPRMSPMLHPAPLFKKRGAKLIADGRGVSQAILFHSFIFLISRSLFLIFYSCFLFTDSPRMSLAPSRPSLQKERGKAHRRWAWGESGYFVSFFHLSYFSFFISYFLFLFLVSDSPRMSLAPSRPSLQKERGKAHRRWAWDESGYFVSFFHLYYFSFFISYFLFLFLVYRFTPDVANAPSRPSLKREGQSSSQMGAG